MSELQHTPGPWEAVEDGERDWKVVSDDFGTIVYRNCYPDESVDVYVEGDAKLIATAPELLEELVTLAGWAEEFAIPAMGDETEGGNSMLASAMAVISKATGNT